MHQNAFGGRAPPGPAEGAHSALPDPLAVFGGGAPPPEMERERGGNGEEEEGGEGKRGEGEKWERGERRGWEGREGSVPSKFLPVPPSPIF